MDSRIKRTQRDYTLAFKRAVVDQVEKGELTYKAAQHQYGIQGRSTVLVWLRKHGRQDWRSLSASSVDRLTAMKDTVLPLTPEQQIKALEVELKEAQEKARLFEAHAGRDSERVRGETPKKAFRQVLTQGKVTGLPVVRACRYRGISRQAYYQERQRQTQRAGRDEQVVALVREVRLRQPRIGTRKLHYLLAEPLSARAIKLGRDGLFALLRDTRLLVPPRRAFHKTTDSFHRFYKHPNLLKNGDHKIIPQRAEQVWVADITYLPTDEQCAYVSLVTDAYSRQIVGYHVHRSLQTSEVSQALRLALKGRQTTAPLIHHSDRGSQYCSADYQAIHQQHQITCSMTDGYDCYQNALAERINGILKTEFLLQRPRNLDEATRMVKQSVAIYNLERPHLALQYKTPDAVHRASIRAYLAPPSTPT